jgi:hypothetical protein
MLVSGIAIRDARADVDVPLRFTLATGRVDTVRQISAVITLRMCPGITHRVIDSW